MTKQPLVPTFTDSLATFIADLRSWVFRSTAVAALHFQLARSTIWRYEDGSSTPPPGYLTALAVLAADRLCEREVAEVHVKIALLEEVNKALLACYPGTQTFLNWETLEQYAMVYRSQREKQPTPSSPKPPPITNDTQIDWGEAPAVTRFYGRQAEITLLSDWLIDEQCRLVSLQGIGGIGKSLFAAHLVEQVASHFFDKVYWRSLSDAPMLDQVLVECITFLSGGDHIALPTTLDAQRRQLIHLLRQQRCLLIFDHLEAILQPGHLPGTYQPDHIAYGTFLSTLGTARHQSRLLLISREQPREVAQLMYAPNTVGRVRSYRLEGLAPIDIATLLDDMGFQADSTLLTRLVEQSSGNPGVLVEALVMLRQAYAGDWQAFMQQGPLIQGQMRAVFREQIARLTSAERTLLRCLADTFAPCTLDQARAAFIEADTDISLFTMVHSLMERSLITIDGEQILLPTVMRDYLRHTSTD